MISATDAADAADAADVDGATECVTEACVAQAVFFEVTILVSNGLNCWQPASENAVITIGIKERTLASRKKFCVGILRKDIVRWNEQMLRGKNCQMLGVAGYLTGAWEIFTM